MLEIQGIISERAVELLNLGNSDGPQFLLDVGCGTGLSGAVINDLGHSFIGVDISANMLEIANSEIDDGDLVLGDMGQGLSFKQGTFDGAISISAVQWLCYAGKSSQNPIKRLRLFFENLYRVLKFGARAVIQLYPENSDQMELITNTALTVGFTGGLVVDYPDSAKAKKYYLCLFAGVARKLPKAKMELDMAEGRSTAQQTQISTFGENGNNGNRKRRRGKERETEREYVLKKKERQRRQGKDVRPDTKYTGRKRPRGF